MLKLKQVRLEKGLSVPALVQLSGVSRRTIQAIEQRGDCMVSNLAKLAEALGVTLNDLWTPDEEAEK
nr:MAG TPA: helix-turn-helix domain protein [Bacteriophage sp.]